MAENDVELFFVVVRKDNWVCAVEEGPFLEADKAREKIVGREQVSSRCFRAVGKVVLPCELLGD